MKMLCVYCLPAKLNRNTWVVLERSCVRLLEYPRRYKHYAKAHSVTFTYNSYYFSLSVSVSMTPYVLFKLKLELRRYE